MMMILINRPVIGRKVYSLSIPSDTTEFSGDVDAKVSKIE